MTDELRELIRRLRDDARRRANIQNYVNSNHVATIEPEHLVQWEATDWLQSLSERNAEHAEEIRDAVIAAYIAGAIDVHEHWQEDRDPDFTEAAHDYATSLTKGGK